MDGAPTTVPARLPGGLCVARSAPRSAPANTEPCTTVSMMLPRRMKPLSPVVATLDMSPRIDLPPCASMERREPRSRRERPPSRRLCASRSKASRAWGTLKRPTILVASPVTAAPLRNAESMAAVVGRPRASAVGARPGGRMTATSQATTPHALALAAYASAKAGSRV